MAAKSFLKPDDFNEALKRLVPPARAPMGDESSGVDLGASVFSKWLGARLLGRLSLHPEWLKAEPILLGSWARGELSPKSDIDLLFAGPHESVRLLVDQFSREGLKIRYRVPEDPDDWTKGVEPFDVLALLQAVPLSNEAAGKLAPQIEKILAKTSRRDLLKAMREERKSRSERYDSISNFLEPNLKFGPGGLRDLEQALVARRLFPERFKGADHAFQVLEYYKSFFLLLRAKLHLSEGGGDVLAAPEQMVISAWLGYRDNKDFMREVQKGLSRVSFYADWAIEQSTVTSSRLKEVESKKLATIDALFTALEVDPSILMQNRVRLAADLIFAGLGASGRGRAKNKSPREDRKIGARLTRMLDPLKDEAPMVAFFRSRLIDHCVPEFRHIIGHVQHDQYHRFTVDAHLLQVLRELKRISSHPTRAGRLKKHVESLSSEERDILAFGCLYHDLAKGRGGDHSVNGVVLAKKDLRRFGKSPQLIREVCWIIEEHLALSAAAFRENPRSPRTWRTLAEKGVKGRRLILLAVFTIVDILGTNPEAWTPWKERLLAELVQELERPETGSLLGLGESLKKAGFKNWERTLEELDPFLIASLPAKALQEDLVSVQSEMAKVKADLPIRVVQLRGGKQCWVRFHAQEDRPGLFLSYVKLLAAAGLGVRHASIHTDAELGVYDWFEVKTTKSAVQVEKLLEAAAKSGRDRQFQVRFDSIELVASDDREWVISFRGRDQSGALTEAVRALFELGAAIRWAKVHTWGRQIDDVFGIAPLNAGAAGGEKRKQRAQDYVKTLVQRFEIGAAVGKKS